MVDRDGPRGRGGSERGREGWWDWRLDDCRRRGAVERVVARPADNCPFDGTRR